MSLPPYARQLLSYGKRAAGFGELVQVRQQQDGTFSAWTERTLDFASFTKGSEFDSEGSSPGMVERVTARPIDDGPDLDTSTEINRGGKIYIVTGISGESVRRWMCEFKEDLGIQRTDRTRLEGR